MSVRLTTIEVKPESFSFLTKEIDSEDEISIEKNNEVIDIMKKTMPSMVKEETEVNLSKPSSNAKKYPKISLSKLEEDHVEVGTDNSTQYIVTLNKLGRKFWKKV